MFIGVLNKFCTSSVRTNAKYENMQKIEDTSPLLSKSFNMLSSAKIQFIQHCYLKLNVDNEIYKS